MSRISQVRCQRSLTALMVVIVATLCSVNASRAAERTLRWKLKPGETINCLAEEKASNDVHGPLGDQKFTRSQIYDIRWDIKEVDSAGTASMVLTVDRIRIKIESQGKGPVFDYDSSSDKEPAPGPIADMMVPMLKLQVKQPISCKMAATGEITDVQVPPEMIEGFKKVQGFDKIAPTFTADGMKQMINQNSLVLPTEGVDVGKTWQTESVVQSPLGKMKTTRIFKYAGLEMHEGKEMDKIETTVKVENPDADKAEAKLEITEQSGKGVIYFDNTVGRLSDGSATTHLKSNVMFMNMKIESTDDTTTTLKYSPAAQK